MLPKSTSRKYIAGSILGPFEMSKIRMSSRHAAETFRETLRPENHIRAKTRSLYLLGGFRRQDGAITRKCLYRNIDGGQRGNRQRTTREPPENQQRTNREPSAVCANNTTLYASSFEGKRRTYTYFFLPRWKRP